jgi:ferritin
MFLNPSGHRSRLAGAAAGFPPFLDPGKATTMIPEKMQDAMNDQINAELHSAYVYLAMAAWAEDRNLDGMASWMKVQAQEEMVHAMKFWNHIAERGGRVTLDPIKEVANEFDSPLAAFEAAYKHECYISDRINKLQDLCNELRDHPARGILQWFLDEQIEEENTADGYVQKFKLCDGNPQGIFMLDNELAARTFVYPPPALAQ